MISIQPYRLFGPPHAIIDRVSQAGFTLFETIISSVYIHSLLDILRTKINTRTRRVMRDLILVNVTVICMDLLVIILIFLNQANLAYPLQDFTYAFKFKIEFAVLNQLMAVAASGSRHGSRQTTWQDERYRRPGQATILKGYSDDDLTGVRLPFLSTTESQKSSAQRTLVASETRFAGLEVVDHAQLAKPSSILTKEQVGVDSNASSPQTHNTAKQVLDPNFDFSPGPDLGFSHIHLGPMVPPTLKGYCTTMKARTDRLLLWLMMGMTSLWLTCRHRHQCGSRNRREQNRISLRQLIFGKQNAIDARSNNKRDVNTQLHHDNMQERSNIAPFAVSPKNARPHQKANLGIVPTKLQVALYIIGWAVSAGSHRILIKLMTRRRMICISGKSVELVT